MDEHFDLSGLSPRARAQFLRIAAAGGIHGGADDDTPTPDPTDAAAPAEGDDAAPPADPAPEAPAAGEGDPAPEGAADPAPQAVELPQLPEDLAAAEEPALRGLHGELQARLDELTPLAQTAADVAVLEQIVERQGAIATELQRRITEAADVASRLEAVAPVALPAPAPVLASVGAVTRNRPAQARTAQTPPPPARTRPRAAIQASIGNGAGVGGDELSMAHLGSLVGRAARGPVQKVYLAGIGAYEDNWREDGLPEPLSKANGALRNDALIREAQEDWRADRRGELVHTAAALGGDRGPCEPFDIIREIPAAFTSEERVAPIFPSRPAGRGGFDFTPAPTLATTAAGTTIWDGLDQGGVDPDDPSTWKPIVDLTCPTAQSCVIEWATGALRFDDNLDMSNPEWVQAALLSLMANKTRDKEGRLLQLIDALSHKYTFQMDYGAVPTLIRAINTALAQGMFTDRLEEAGYTVLLPPGVVAACLNDRASKGYNDNDVSDLMAYIRANVVGVDRVVATLDASAGGEPGVPFAALNPVGNAAIELPEVGGTYRVRLVEPSAGLYAETGETQTGIQRSPDLVRMNKAQFFAEQAFMLCKSGPQPWFSLDVELCDNGSRAGLTEPFICAQAS